MVMMNIIGVSSWNVKSSRMHSQGQRHEVESPRFQLFQFEMFILMYLCDLNNRKNRIHVKYL